MYIHIILLFVLLIYCVNFALYYLIKANDLGTEDAISLAREAKSKKFDFWRFVGWVLLVYEGFQLSSLAFVKEFQFSSNETSPLQLPFFGTFFQIIKIITLKLSDWMSLILFCVFFIVTTFAAIWTKHLKRDMHHFLNQIIWDFMYIPATRSFVEAFVCTYHCNFFGQPASFKPYPPMDLYHSVPCNSVGYTIWFAAGYIGTLMLQPLALNFVAFKKNESDAAMRLRPRFNVLFYVCKLGMVVTSTISPNAYIVLGINTIILFALLIFHIYLQPCLGFGLGVNNLRSALFFGEFSSNFFALLAEIWPAYTEIFVILMPVVYVCGAVVVYNCNAIRGWKKSLPRYPLVRLLYGFKTDYRLTACLSIVDKIEDVTLETMKPAILALIEIAQSDSATAKEHDLAMSYLVMASCKKMGPPAFAAVGGSVDLVKLVLRGTLSSRKDIQDVQEIISNIAEYDPINKYTVPPSQMTELMELILFLSNAMPESEFLPVLIKYGSNFMQNKKCVELMRDSPQLQLLEKTSRNVDASSIISSVLSDSIDIFVQSHTPSAAEMSGTLAQLCSFAVHPIYSVAGHACYSLLFVLIRVRDLSFNREVKNAMELSPCIQDMKNKTDILGVFALQEGDIVSMLLKKREEREEKRRKALAQLEDGNGKKERTTRKRKSDGSYDSENSSNGEEDSEASRNYDESKRPKEVEDFEEEGTQENKEESKEGDAGLLDSDYVDVSLLDVNDDRPDNEIEMQLTHNRKGLETISSLGRGQKDDSKKQGKQFSFGKFFSWGKKSKKDKKGKGEIEEEQISIEDQKARMEINAQNKVLSSLLFVPWGNQDDESEEEEKEANDSSSQRNSDELQASFSNDFESDSSGDRHGHLRKERTKNSSSKRHGRRRAKDLNSDSSDGDSSSIPLPSEFSSDSSNISDSDPIELALLATPHNGHLAKERKRRDKKRERKRKRKQEDKKNGKFQNDSSRWSSKQKSQMNKNLEQALQNPHPFEKTSPLQHISRVVRKLKKAKQKVPLLVDVTKFHHEMPRDFEEVEEGVFHSQLTKKLRDNGISWFEKKVQERKEEREQRLKELLEDEDSNETDPSRSSSEYSDERMRRKRHALNHIDDDDSDDSDVDLPEPNSPPPLSLDSLSTPPSPLLEVDSDEEYDKNGANFGDMDEEDFEMDLPPAPSFPPAPSPPSSTSLPSPPSSSSFPLPPSSPSSTTDKSSNGKQHRKRKRKQKDISPEDELSKQARVKAEAEAEAKEKEEEEAERQVMSDPTWFDEEDPEFSILAFEYDDREDEDEDDEGGDEGGKKRKGQRLSDLLEEKKRMNDYLILSRAYFRASEQSADDPSNDPDADSSFGGESKMNKSASSGGTLKSLAMKFSLLKGKSQSSSSDVGASSSNKDHKVWTSPLENEKTFAMFRQVLEQRRREKMRLNESRVLFSSSNAQASAAESNPLSAPESSPNVKTQISPFSASTKYSDAVNAAASAIGIRPYFPHSYSLPEEAVEKQANQKEKMRKEELPDEKDKEDLDLWLEEDEKKELEAKRRECCQQHLKIINQGVMPRSQGISKFAYFLKGKDNSASALATGEQDIWIYSSFIHDCKRKLLPSFQAILRPLSLAFLQPDPFDEMFNPSILPMPPIVRENVKGNDLLKEKELSNSHLFSFLSGISPLSCVDYSKTLTEAGSLPLGTALHQSMLSKLNVNGLNSLDASLTIAGLSKEIANKSKKSEDWDEPVTLERARSALTETFNTQPLWIMDERTFTRPQCRILPDRIEVEGFVLVRDMSSGMIKLDDRLFLSGSTRAERLEQYSFARAPYYRARMALRLNLTVEEITTDVIQGLREVVKTDKTQTDEFDHQNIAIQLWTKNEFEDEEEFEEKLLGGKVPEKKDNLTKDASGSSTLRRGKEGSGKDNAKYNEEMSLAKPYTTEYEKQKERADSIFQLMNTRISDIGKVRNELMHSKTIHSKNIKDSDTMIRCLVWLIKSKLKEKYIGDIGKVLMRLFSIFTSVPEITRYIVDKGYLQQENFGFRFDQGKCFTTLFASIENIVVSNPNEFVDSREHILEVLNQSYHSGLKYSYLGRCLESCACACIKTRTHAFTVACMMGPQVLGASRHFQKSLIVGVPKDHHAADSQKSSSSQNHDESKVSDRKHLTESQKQIFMLSYCLDRIEVIIPSIFASLLMLNPLFVEKRGNDKECYFAAHDEDSAEELYGMRCKKDEAVPLCTKWLWCIRVIKNILSLLTHLCYDSWDATLLCCTYKRFPNFLTVDDLKSKKKEGLIIKEQKKKSRHSKGKSRSRKARKRRVKASRSGSDLSDEEYFQSESDEGFSGSDSEDDESSDDSASISDPCCYCTPNYSAINKHRMKTGKKGKIVQGSVKTNPENEKEISEKEKELMGLITEYENFKRRKEKSMTKTFDSISNYAGFETIQIQGKQNVLDFSMEGLGKVMCRIPTAKDLRFNEPKYITGTTNPDDAPIVLHFIFCCLLSKIASVRRAALVTLISMLSVHNKSDSQNFDLVITHILRGMSDAKIPFALRSMIQLFASTDNSPLDPNNSREKKLQSGSRAIGKDLTTNLESCLERSQTAVLCMDLVESFVRLSFEANVDKDLRNKLVGEQLPTAYVIHWVSRYVTCENVDVLAVLVLMADESVIKVLMRTHVPFVLLEARRSARRKIAIEALLRMVNTQKNESKPYKWQNTALRILLPYLYDSTICDEIIKCYRDKNDFLDLMEKYTLN
ncbi:uncharacterized protein MONOS_1595 [Monocercomonoides exilis]|uniref:uncharacterized protein n=1 Tax=Monocercomonoides exilis TaxID=2049356 RepID=UPI00355A789E|nr:hypothetical protein MONOS_1595 [Monocercomonoides exilis]